MFCGDPRRKGPSGGPRERGTGPRRLTYPRTWVGSDGLQAMAQLPDSHCQPATVETAFDLTLAQGRLSIL